MRTGKIARLPHAIRTQLNHRLQSGASASKLLPWLNNLPEVRATMREYFHSRPINPQNLSEWRMGGYQDWLQDQSPGDLAHCLTETATAFTSTHSPLTDALHHWTATRLALRTRRINALQESDPEAADKLLTKLIRDLTTLQQSQTRVRREQRQRDHLTFRETQARQKAEREREQTDADHERWALHPDNQKRLWQSLCAAYPDEYFTQSDDDEEDEDQSEDQNREPEENLTDQSHAASVAHPTEDDPTAHRYRDDRTPEQKAAHPAIYVQSRGGRAPIGRTEAHPPRPLPPLTPNTNATIVTDPGDDQEEPTDSAELIATNAETTDAPTPSAICHSSQSACHLPSTINDQPSTALSAICHVPSAIPSPPTHPITKSPHPVPPRKPSPSDASREAVARLLDPKGFAKYGLAVFNHLPLPEPLQQPRGGKIGGYSG